MRRLRQQDGFSLVEVVLTVALLTIVVGAGVYFVRMTLNGFGATEARATIIHAAQEIGDRLGHELPMSHRIFDAPASAFVSRLNLPLPSMPGTRLPTIEPSGSLSPSSSTFVADGVGNSLFFAQELDELDFSVPTSSGTNRSYRIDRYQFNYFYITQDPTLKMGGAPLLNVQELQSIPYADATEILGITDTVAGANLVNALLAAGIAHACDLSKTDPSSAFYALSTGTITLEASHQIISNGPPISLLRLGTGMAGGSYRYGLCPNRSTSFAPKDVVPLYGTPSGAFPAGFEVVIVGSSTARQVLVRIVLAAEGSFPQPVSYQHVAVTPVVDSW